MSLENVRSNIRTKFSDLYSKISETKSKIQQTVQKVNDFIKENKSLILFGLTVLFSYFMAPISAFEYMSLNGYSLAQAFLEGAVFGTTVFTLKNLFTSKSITKSQDDKINCLLSVANVGKTLLNPTSGLISSISTSGFITVKTLASKLFVPEDRKIAFLVPK